MAKSNRHVLPRIGATFHVRYKRNYYHLLVASKDGKVVYKFNGRVFLSPTAAAKNITKNEVNGWRFWKID